MKKTFKEFYNPDYDELWENCVFIFDTNVLLNLYRYKEETRDAFFDVLEKIGIKKWLPYQVGYEYHKNRLDVIYELNVKAEDIKKSTDEALNKISENFTEVRKQNSISGRDEENIQSSIKTLANISKKYKENVSKKCKEYKDNDNIQNKLLELFDNKIGENYSFLELEKLYSEAKIRFEKKIQPGYRDIKKEGNDKYSDYIIWRQILDFAKNNQTCVVFVTADEKEDWWGVCKGEKYCSPQLKKEFYDYVGKEFHMYTPERFIDEAKKYYKLRYSEDVIEEVKRVRRPIRPFLNREYIETQERREPFSIYNIIKETVYRTEDFISFLSHLERVFDIEFIPPVISTLKRIKMTYDDVKVIPRHDIHDVVNFIMMEHSIKNGQRKLFDEMEEM